MQATASARLPLKRTHSRVACPHNPELAYTYTHTVVTVLATCGLGLKGRRAWMQKDFAENGMCVWDEV